MAATRKGVKRKAGGWRTALAVLAVLAAALLWGLFGFVRDIPRPPADPAAGASHPRADAVVVLTGGRGRVEKGLELLAADRADRLFISGVDQTVDMKTLVDSGAIPPRLSDCCVTLGHAARNTRENAEETADWVRSEGVRSILLVTADFHMPRSLAELRAELPDKQIVPAPVFSENVHLDSWWTWPGTSALLAGEYLKYLGVRLRQIARPARNGDPA